MPYGDTSPAAREMQLEVLRRLSGEELIEMAYDMSMFARELAKAGIRKDHPEWSEAEIARELLRLAFLPEPLPSGF